MLLEQLKIDNFRGFDHIEIEGFSKINLFVGKNNSGKTSVLEALLLVMGISDPMLPSYINNEVRGLSDKERMFYNRRLVTAEQNNLRYIYHNINTNVPPKLYAQFDNRQERWLKIKPIYHIKETSIDSINMIDGLEMDFEIAYNQNQHKKYKSSVSFVNSDDTRWRRVGRDATDYMETIYPIFVSASDKDDTETLKKYSDIIKEQKKAPIVDALKAFDSNVIDAIPLVDGIYFNLKGIQELIPSNVMGDGIRRFLNIVTASSNKTHVLIDEIENGLHHSAYDVLWKSLLIFSKQNDIQMFITTHNVEVLSSLISVLKEDKFKSMQQYSTVFNVAKTLNAGYKAYKYSFEGFNDAIENENEIRD